MSKWISPLPENEMDRLLGLADLDIDYSEHQDSFKDLAKLAAKISGTSISMVNLIDSITQWTISNYGMDMDQMSREDSVCQYTIMGSDPFEVGDLQADERFRDKYYVTGEPNIRYYYGIPLRTGEGLNIGALCVLDREKLKIEPEKVELMKIIADEIVNRLRTIKVMEGLKRRLLEAKQSQQKVAHDIRGPLGGIVGLAQIIKDQGESNQIDEVLEFISLIHKSGNSILELAEDILETSKEGDSTKAAMKANAGEFNLSVFKGKLEKLYGPQARHKRILFTVQVNSQSENLPFSSNKLLQITGNLISNSIKFTQELGSVSVYLNLAFHLEQPVLQIIVRDTGVGMNQETIAKILEGNVSSSDGTGGERGYGFGLSLVAHLVNTLGGKMHVVSEPGQGSTFEVTLPQQIS